MERNLPQLQNLIKRDPESYEDDLDRQYAFFRSQLVLFKLRPDEFNKSLDDIVMFLAQVAKCYPRKMEGLPQILVDLLRDKSTVLDPDMRMTFCRALILLRHKGLLEPTDLLKLFFELLKCPDKTLRKFLKDHIINDIKGVNAKKKDARLNASLQNFMFKVVADGEKAAAKTSLDVMTELYRKNIWRDAKTVNVIAGACFSDVTKLTVTALNFFLGKDGDNDEDGKNNNNDSDSEDELPSLKNAALANKVNRSSRKREKFLNNLKKAHKKKRRKEKVAEFNFSALHLVHDPQGFAEKLYKKLDGLKEKFEIKLLFLDLISRLIGTHELIVFNYYPYIARFLNPHQREVVKMLQFSAQAAHELVPGDALEPVIRAIVNNFVTERNAAEVMAVGLNAVRELCKRCPLAMDETLLTDLSGYKTYKDKGVMMASRSLIALYRTSHPELLHKRDRGRPTEAMAEAGVKEFGHLDAKDYVPGAEAVNADENNDTFVEDNGDDEGDDNDGEWINVVHSSDEGEEDNEDEEEEMIVEEGDEDEDDETRSTVSSTTKAGTNKEYLTLEEKKQKAAEAATSRIFTDADFKRIDSAQLKKQVQSFRKGGNKRKRSAVAEEENEAASNADGAGRNELVDLSAIEMVHKKRKHDKESRLASVMEGREGRDKFGSRKGKADENSSTTHKQKAKKKNFMMVKHKLKRKVKRSFTEKARDLKKSLMRSRKFK